MNYELKKGCSGERVRVLQMLLNRVIGFTLVADGDFGSKTEMAVRAFQNTHLDENGTFLKDDGIFGEKSLKALARIVGEEAVAPLLVVEVIPPFAKGLNMKRAAKWVRGIVLHCTAEREDRCAKSDAKSIDRIHKAQGWKGIGYHYVIKQDGTIENGRDVEKRGAHAGQKNIFAKDKYDLNTYTLGIVYTGGYDKDGKVKDTRTPQQKESMLWLVKKLCEMYNLTEKDVYCHNQFANKACPCFKAEDFRKEMKKMKDVRCTMYDVKEDGRGTMYDVRGGANKVVSILLLLLAFFCSCSRKVIDTHTESETHIEQTAVKDVEVSDKNVWNIGINSSAHIMTGIDEWWKAHIKRTLYTTDSLGNQSVSMTEEIDIDGGKRTDVDDEGRTMCEGSGESEHHVLIHDTVYIKEDADSVTDTEEVHEAWPPPMPWWWKCCMVGGLLAFLCVALYRIHNS